MWFWSVSWSTNCSVYFSFFWSTKEKIVQSQAIFGQSLNFLFSLFLKIGHPLISKEIRGWPFFKKGWTKNSETDQKLPETGLLLSWWITFIIFKIRIMWTAWFCHTRERQLIVKKKCESSDDTKDHNNLVPLFFLFFYIT